MLNNNKKELFMSYENTLEKKVSTGAVLAYSIMGQKCTHNINADRLQMCFLSRNSINAKN